MAHLNSAFLFIVSLFVFSSAHPERTQEQPQQQAQEPHYHWKPLVEIVDSTFEAAFLPPYVNFSRNFFENDRSIGAQCKADLLLAMQALHSRQHWAVQLFNSWGKLPPSGMTAGTMTDFGDYGQCLQVRPSAQYCLLEFAFPMPGKPVQHNYHHKSVVLPPPPPLNWGNLSATANESLYRKMEQSAAMFHYLDLRLGVCLPVSCHRSEVAAYSADKISQVGLRLKTVHCETNADNQFRLNYVQLSAVAFLVFTVTISLIAAVYDRLYYDKTKVQPLIWFSPMRNVRKLFQTKSSENDFACIHALRVFSISWIVFGHTLEWNSLNMYRDSFSLKDQVSSLFLQFFFKGPYAVETFFYISGFLTSYIILKMTARRYSNFRYLPFLTLRYLRLMPQLFIYILLSFLLQPLFSGPIWRVYTEKLANNCYKNWWINALNLQNFLSMQESCANHTWYVATDMQLHLLSLVPVVFVLIYKRKGLFATLAVVLFCMVINTLTIYRNKYHPDLIITSKTDYRDDFDNPSERLQFYFTPWNHAIVYFGGFLFGYFLPDGNTNLKLKRTPKYACWAAVLLLYLTVLYSTTPYLYGVARENHYSAVLFAFNRTLWAVMLTAILWLCLTKNGGIGGRLLCWSAWRPLSRMTYAVYLTHAWVLHVVLGARRDLIDLNVRSVLVHCTGTLVMCYLVAAVFTVFFESPLVQAIDGFKRYLKPANADKKSFLDFNENCSNPAKDLNSVV